MNTWQNAVSLYAFYDRDTLPVGYTLSRALYTTMSMDNVRWRALLALQNGKRGGDTYDEDLLSTELARTDFVMQKGKQNVGLGGKLSTEVQTMLAYHVYHYPMAKDCFFHAKLIILCFSKDGCPDYYRIAVTSKNLTCDSDDQNFFWCDGYASGQRTPNGNRLWAYIYALQQAYDQVGDKSASFDPAPFERIQTIVLDEGIGFYFSGVAGGLSLGYNNLHDMIFDGQSRVMAVTKSKFVGDTYRAAAQKGQWDNTFFEVWNRWDGKDDPTHMKLYHTCDDRHNYILWMGSANCSSNALGTGGQPGNNVECLVRVPATQMFHEIRQMLRQQGYCWQTSFAPHQPEGDEPKSALLQKLYNDFEPTWTYKRNKWKIYPSKNKKNLWNDQASQGNYHFKSKAQNPDGTWYGIFVYPIDVYEKRGKETDHNSLAVFSARKLDSENKVIEELGEMLITPTGARFPAEEDLKRAADIAEQKRLEEAVEQALCKTPWFDRLLLGETNMSCVRPKLQQLAKKVPTKADELNDLLRILEEYEPWH